MERGFYHSPGGPVNRPGCQIELWHRCQYLEGMGNIRKVTVHIPEDLLDRAQRSSGEGITQTIRRGLQLVAAGDAYRKLRALRGKVAVSVDLEKLRNDG